MTHPNIDFMRRYSETLTAGKAADVLPYFAEDLVLHIPGRSPHAGTLRGKDAVLSYYTRVFRDTDGRFQTLGVDDILASDTHAASLVRWRVERNGKELLIDRVVIYRIEGEKIKEIWVRDWDQYAYDELFADAVAEPEPVADGG